MDHIFGMGHVVRGVVTFVQNVLGGERRSFASAHRGACQLDDQRASR
jgi:hypothetical protein